MTHFLSHSKQKMVSASMLVAGVSIILPLHGAAAERLPNMSKLLQAVVDSGETSPTSEAIVRAARDDVGEGIFIRPYTLDELRNIPDSMKYPEQPHHMRNLSAEAWKLNALSLGDSRIAHRINIRLPRVAAAAVLTNDPELMRYVLDQLEEVATWEPFQRAGWSLSNSNTTIVEEGDGPWLGTGWLIRGVCDAIDLLPEGTLSPELREALVARFDDEIERFLDDWKNERAHYMRNQSVHSNQWVLPNEGLLRACLFVGKDRHPEAYELAVGNLLRTLEVQGEKGEYVEGLEYAALTMNSMLATGWSMAEEGDMRLLEHPFLQNFPLWFVHHEQPGGQVINAFDSKSFALNRDILAQMVLSNQSQYALWAIENHRNTGFPPSVVGLLASVADIGEAKEPSLYAHYPVAARINWRDSWDENASGFWFRGGHRTDAHDHMDRGHVNFIVKGRPVLIEAGLYSYGIPEHSTHFRAVPGHNVLQVGPESPAELTGGLLNSRAGQILRPDNRHAPITVERLDEQGGKASADMSACYASVERWVRYVEWNSDTVTVRDEVELKTDEVVTFRWHLGELPGAEQQRGDGRIQVGDVLVEYSATTDVTVEVEKMPDNTLRRSRGMGYHECVVIQSSKPVRTFELTSKISLID